MGQLLAGRALLAQQALAAEHHIAVEERFGQCVVGIVRGTDPLMDVLSQKVQLQITADLGVRLAVANPVQDDFLGCVQRRHYFAILLGQFQAAGFRVQVADRLEQVGLELEVAAKLHEQLCQALLHRLVGEQRLPQDREQPIPRRTGHQQQRFVPEIADLPAALVHADHGVHREDQRRRGDGAVAFAQGTEHGQGEGCQGQCASEDPG